MEYSNERLEKLINFFSKKYKHANDFIPDDEAYKRFFIQETTNMKTFLNRKSLAMESERSFKILIQQYQLQIAVWLNDLFDEKRKENFAYPEWAIEFIVEELQSLLSFIYNRYPSFFNLDEKLPEISLQQIRESLRERFQKLRKHLVKEFKNEEHVELALLPLKKLLNPDSKNKISYRFLFYTKRIEKTLLEFACKRCPGGLCEDNTIIKLIILLNYNCEDAHDFLTSKITTEVKDEDRVENKINRLCFFLKEFRQLEEKPHLAFKSRSRSLKEQIIGWITEEIYYHENNPLSVPASLAAKQESLLSEEKVQLSVSVEVFTIIVRAAKDNKLIVTKHATELFKIVSKYFSTRQVNTISTQSLRNKSYDAKSSAKREAIDFLHGMIRSIHDY
jgi:hypothetical protein